MQHSGWPQYHELQQQSQYPWPQADSQTEYNPMMDQHYQYNNQYDQYNHQADQQQPYKSPQPPPPPPRPIEVITEKKRSSDGDQGLSHKEAFKTGNWGGEISTLILSVLIQAAVVGILVWMHDKPYFQTWTIPLSINSVLAILSAAGSAAGLHAVGSAIGQLKWIEYKTKPRSLKLWDIYDDCSRGPEGAIKALFRMPGSIIVVGALIIMGSMAVDPFTQQAVHLEPRNVTSAVADDGSVAIGFATDYNTYPRQSAMSWYNSPDIASRDPGIRGAIMQGIFGIGKTTPEFRCGGACSWPDTYRTLAFASACTNVTQATAATKKCSKPQSERICNMTTPGGVSLQTRFVATASATVLVLNTTANRDFFNTTEDSVADPGNLLRLAVFRSTSGPDSFFNAPDIIDEDVTECTVSLVLREFSDIRTNGTQFNPGRVTDRALGKGSWADSDREDVMNSYFYFNTTAEDEGEGKPMMKKNVTIGQQDLINMFAYFDSPSFRSEIISGDSRGLGTEGAGSALLQPAISDGKNSTATKGDPAEIISRSVSAMTDAMSEYVRSGTPNSVPVRGSRVEQIVFVDVVWWWLIFPLTIRLTSVVFVLLIIWKNRREGGLPLWKNSAIAMILHTYDPEQRVLRAPTVPVAVALDDEIDSSRAGGQWGGEGGGAGKKDVKRMLERTVTLEVR